jgi:molybdate transport system substrate-binding protein
MGMGYISCKFFIAPLLLPLLLSLVVACDMEKYPLPATYRQEEILIYSGTTMLLPMMDIVALFEDRENSKVEVSYEASGHIMKSVEINQVGDIFFPGSSPYVDTLMEKGTVLESAQVGYNEIGLFVQPENPKGISADPGSLPAKDLRIVIGNDKSGSIGREIRNALDQRGYYQTVVEKALYLATDSEDIAGSIKEKEADLVLNWKAVAFIPENAGLMNYIPLPEGQRQQQPLVMGLLGYSRVPDLAKKFIKLATSAKGQAIFRKYGFQDSL